MLTQTYPGAETLTEWNPKVEYNEPRVCDLSEKDTMLHSGYLDVKYLNNLLAPPTTVVFKQEQNLDNSI